MDHETAGELLGAYSLDACDQQETALLEGHLATCGECRVELAKIQMASGWLGVSETASPPAWLRAQIVQEAGGDTSVRYDRRHGTADRRVNDPGPSRRDTPTV